jgi:hypothetical protein
MAHAMGQAMISHRNDDRKMTPDLAPGKEKPLMENAEMQQCSLAPVMIRD